jgi:hypothetical protein
VPQPQESQPDACQYTS